MVVFSKYYFIILVDMAIYDHWLSAHDNVTMTNSIGEYPHDAKLLALGLGSLLLPGAVLLPVLGINNDPRPIKAPDPLIEHSALAASHKVSELVCANGQTVTVSFNKPCPK
jgi:hypothetical protein